tara:strand:+ start:24028 stop:24780 length:753 start_codon:yes stop_codon:yes gene_type:complete
MRRLARDAQVRDSEGLFVVEGPRLVQEAIEAGLKIDQVILPEDELDDALLMVLSQEKIHFNLVPRKIFDGLTTLRNPQAAIAAVRKHDLGLTSVIEKKETMLILLGVADPGNCGNLIRTSEAFGVSSILFYGGVDPYNPKVVRSSAGSFFRVSFSILPESFSYTLLFEELNSYGYRTIATASSGGLPPEDVLIDKQVALILGNEPRGLPEEIEDSCDKTITIPIEKSVESLNVATAGAIALYAIRRSIGV